MNKTAKTTHMLRFSGRTGFSFGVGATFLPKFARSLPVYSNVALMACRTCFLSEKLSWVELVKKWPK